MSMKEDAMKNGQLKPAYNAQYGVDSEYIVWLTVGYQFATYYHIKSIQNFLYFKYPNITEDVGYEIEENYLYLKENMEYNEADKYYICKNSKKLTLNRTLQRKSKTGYVGPKTVYTCENCSNCKYKNKCIKGHNCKTPLGKRVKNLETSKLFKQIRKDNLERIVSKE